MVCSRMNSNSRQELNRRRIESAFRVQRIATKLVITNGEAHTRSEAWSDYWRRIQYDSCVSEAVRRQLRGFRASWVEHLRRPSVSNSRYFAWQYFCLLQHTIRRVRNATTRNKPWNLLQRVLAFGTVSIEITGQVGTAAGFASFGNPVYQLGWLALKKALPTPKHVPLIQPLECSTAFHYYRQISLRRFASSQFFVCPAINLKDRIASFGALNTLRHQIASKPDPYWRPRAAVLVGRVIKHLLRARKQTTKSKILRIMDIGAGTGHFCLSVWKEFQRTTPNTKRLKAEIHLIDLSYQSNTRLGFRKPASIKEIEWTAGDYRRLLDDDLWLVRNGAFDWILMCRLLDNISSYSIESIASDALARAHCSPVRCLEPSTGRSGLEELQVQRVKRRDGGGTVMPQYSLCDYFEGLRILSTRDVYRSDECKLFLPIRRFNPASLTTLSGRSIFGQLFRITRALIIEDIDLLPEHLLAHRESFGLDNLAAFHFDKDGFKTEAQHYLIVKAKFTRGIPGTRLW